MSGARRGTRVTITGRAAIGLPSRTPRRVATLLGLFLALTALAATLAAASASAAECYSGGSRCPGLAEDQHLTDTDGIVMPTTTTYFVYWDPKGAPAYPAKYKSGIKTFFKGLEHDNGTDQNFYSVLTQYGVKYETHLGKTITDKDPYPAETSECSSRPSTPCISLVQIQAELKSLVKNNKLPGQVTEHGQESFFGPTKAYFILLPPGVSACDASREEVNAQGQKVRHVGLGCSGVQYCSLHDYSLVPTDELEDLPYAVLAYLPGIKGCEDPQRPNGTVDDELVVMEHEFAEMITDPFLTGWLNLPTVGTEEVADICQDGQWGAPSQSFEEKMRWGTALGTAPNGALYNQLIDGHYYYLQQLYSDATETCVQRKALPPVVSELAPANGSVAGGTKVEITGLNFENPAVTSVSFGKVAAKEFTVTSPTSITAVTPASASAGVVEVKLTSPGGTSAGTSADDFTYEAK